ncbi:MAG: hypothetical protein ACQKBW_11125 [Puniceicoccales bacterium]
MDWWTLEKPLGWIPEKEKKTVSLNHDFGSRPSYNPRKSQWSESQDNVPHLTLLSMGSNASANPLEQSKNTAKHLSTRTRSSAQDAEELKAREKLIEPASPTIRFFRGITRWLHEQDNCPRQGGSGIRG